MIADAISALSEEGLTCDYGRHRYCFQGDARLLQGAHNFQGNAFAPVITKKIFL